MLEAVQRWIFEAEQNSYFPPATSSFATVGLMTDMGKCLPRRLGSASPSPLIGTLCSPSLGCRAPLEGLQLGVRLMFRNRVRSYVARWDQIDISDPTRIRLMCPLSQLWKEHKEVGSPRLDVPWQTICLRPTPKDSRGVLDSPAPVEQHRDADSSAATG